MSQAWICSRRKAEEFISKGLVKVNGQVATLWMSIISWKDKVELLDKAIEEQKNFVYYKINKPRWVETTCAQYWTNSIIDIVDIKERVFPIGRLDKDTTWLILLTNDGRLTNYLIHPRYEHEKEYVVEVFWRIEDEALEQMSDWLHILWSITKEAKVKRLSSWKFSIILEEWRNRQIRRMCEKVWHGIKRLKRIRIENIKLWTLDEWEYMALTYSEKKALFNKIWLNFPN